MGEGCPVRIASFPDEATWEAVNERLQAAGADLGVFVGYDSPIRQLRIWGRALMKSSWTDRDTYHKFRIQREEAASLIEEQRELIHAAGFSHYEFGLAIPSPTFELPEDIRFPQAGVTYDWPPARIAARALAFLKADNLPPEQADTRHLAVTLAWRDLPT